jgi:hypothetical protein
LQEGWRKERWCGEGRSDGTKTGGEGWGGGEERKITPELAFAFLRDVTPATQKRGFL